MKSILIAEDEPKLRNIYEEVLTDEGYRVTLVENGSLALKCLTEDTFDLIVTDIKMPEMDGIEFIRRVRELNDTIPIIVCSAYKGMKNDFDIVYSGAEFISKPVDIDELAGMINTRLGGA